MSQMKLDRAKELFLHLGHAKNGMRKERSQEGGGELLLSHHFSNVKNLFCTAQFHLVRTAMHAM